MNLFIASMVFGLISYLFSALQQEWMQVQYDESVE